MSRIQFPPMRRLGVVILVILVSKPLLAGAAADAKTVTLKIENSDPDRKKSYQDLTWTKGMSVLDAMNLAKSKSPKLNFKYRGSGRTAFLWSIDGIDNQGSSGRNWIFRVDGKLSVKSFGIHELQPGSVVTWKFEEYP